MRCFTSFIDSLRCSLTSIKSRQGRSCNKNDVFLNQIISFLFSRWSELTLELRMNWITIRSDFDFSKRNRFDLSLALSAGRPNIEIKFLVIARGVNLS
jgi:hypothetical protein